MASTAEKTMAYSDRNSSLLDNREIIDDDMTGNYSFIANEDFNSTSGIMGEPACCEPGLERIIVPLIFAIVVVLGCLGNSLVIAVVLKNRDQFRTTTNLFIINLAFADLLFLLFCVPFHAVIYTTTGDWPFGEFMCKFVHLMQYSGMVASILTLVVMSLDRYLAVAHPLGTKHIRTPMKALIISIIIWIVSLSIALPWPVFYTVRIYDNFGPEPVAICADDWGDSRQHKPTYFLILFILSYVLPLLIISILSALMIYQLWRLTELEGQAGEESVRAKRKVTKLVIAVVVVFFICWLPSHVFWLLSHFSKTWLRPTYGIYYFRIFAHVLSYGNSAMNPIVYAFLSKNFRKGFCKALNCTKNRINPSATLNGGTKTVYSLYSHNEDHPMMQTEDTTV